MIYSRVRSSLVSCFFVTMLVGAVSYYATRPSEKALMLSTITDQQKVSESSELSLSGSRERTYKKVRDGVPLQHHDMRKLVSFLMMIPFVSHHNNG